MGGAPSASLNGLRQCSTAAIDLDWRTGPTEKNCPTLAAPWGIVQTTDGFCTSLHNRPPETRNRIEPDRDAKYTACGPCGRRGARKPPCPDLFSQCATRAAPTTTPIPTPGAWHAPCPFHARFMPGPSGLPCTALPAPLPGPRARKRTARFRPGSTPHRQHPAQNPARRAGHAVSLPRHVRTNARSCSGSINMIMMRTWATASAVLLHSRPRNVHGLLREPPERRGQTTAG